MIENARSVLRKYYGYTSFRKGQKKVIENIINGRDTVAIMPTGSGKSICYQIPALLYPGVTLVISPLISLMKDQVDALQEMGIPATYINSTINNYEMQQRLNKVRQGDYKLIYVAPERLRSGQFYQLLQVIEVSLLAIDEAHCVSQWGHDFRPSYLDISKVLRNFSNRPIVAAFTATATPEVRKDIVEQLNLNNPAIYITGFDRENLTFIIRKGINKDEFILDYLKDNHKESGIIYAATRKEVDRIYNLLLKKGYKAGRYHAGLTDEERHQTQENFLFDNIDIVIATNAFGMGIDKSNVRYVIHYNMPKNIEAYYQEAGRAGRDGERSECILLYSPGDNQIQRFLIEQTETSLERKAEQFNKLKAMVDYCHTSRCLRGYILEYFGDSSIEDCENCSNCNDNQELIDITIDAQKIFSCVYRLKEKWGTTVVAQVLSGSRNQKILDNNLDQLSTYGIMKEYTIKKIREIINVLTADGYLYLSGDRYPVVNLAGKAYNVLKGEEKVYQKVPVRIHKINSDNALFDLLRDLRKEIAIKENVPPYVIFHDKTLRDMSSFFPLDNKSLLKIPGVGEMKVKKFGQEFIKVIGEYVKNNNIEVEKRDFNYSENKSSRTSIKDSHLITLEMYKKGLSLEDIAKERDLTVRTIENHFFKCSQDGLEVDLNMFIPADYEEDIFAAIAKKGTARLRPIKEILPDEVSYTAIKAVLLKYNKNKLA